MKQVICPNCSQKCIRHGVLKSGSQRWFCKSCKIAFTNKLSTALRGKAPIIAMKNAFRKTRLQSAIIGALFIRKTGLQRAIVGYFLFFVYKFIFKTIYIMRGILM